YPNRVMYLSNLRSTLKGRYKRMGNIDNLKAAILRVEEAVVSATPKDYSNRVGRLSNLKSILKSQYKRIGNIDNLKAAILRVGVAVSAIPKDYPN
ncbi:uncharacterized protein K441DRAFT_578372, partial [Cenococcum geophilum 1.58]|uniref:uncharacterized protein n=1 Tax=Cenococcum geophilum 1.58 TaxID=794803 RepID=UPI00358E20F1